MIRLSAPDGTLPAFLSEEPDLSAALGADARISPENKSALLWLTTGGREGKAPSILSASRGSLFAMRSGWEPGAGYLAGDFGAGRLTFALASGGRHFVLGARCRVDSDNGAPALAAVPAFAWRMSSEIDYAEAGIDGAVTRRIFYLKPSTWILLDTAQPAGAGTMFSALELAGLPVERNVRDGSVAVGGNPVLKVIPLGPNPGLKLSIEQEGLSPQLVWSVRGEGRMRMALAMCACARDAAREPAVETIPAKPEEALAVRFTRKWRAWRDEAPEREAALVDFAEETTFLSGRGSGPLQALDAGELSLGARAGFLRKLQGEFAAIGMIDGKLMSGCGVSAASAAPASAVVTRIGKYYRVENAGDSPAELDIAAPRIGGMNIYKILDGGALRLLREVAAEPPRPDAMTFRSEPYTAYQVGGKIR